MRILFYNHAPEISGAERVLLSIMEMALQAGHEVVLCAPAGPLGAEAARLGATVQPMAGLTLGYARNPLVLAGYLVRLLAPLGDLVRVARRLRPDLVYANSARSGLVAVAARRRLRPRPRLVVHLHDAVGSAPLDRVVALVMSRGADAVVAISRYVGRNVGGPVHVLYNSVDAAAYQAKTGQAEALRRRLGIPLEAPLLAVVGQVTPWKGQREALDAFARVRATVPQAHLVIAGTAKFVGKHRRYDTVAYQGSLVARARESDLRGHVHFAGDIPDVAAAYAAATVLVVPSWAEPFGRVIIEAMAAGCPVLATRAGGVPEIITHGVDGWLVPPRDSAALADALCLLLGDAALRASLSAAGQATVARCFSAEQYAASLQHLLASLVQESPVPTPRG